MTPIAVKKVISFVRENNGIEYAYSISRKFALEAKNSLEVFPDSQTKLALESLVDFVTERKN